MCVLFSAFWIADTVVFAPIATAIRLFRCLFHSPNFQCMYAIQSQIIRCNVYYSFIVCFMQLCNVSFLVDYTKGAPHRAALLCYSTSEHAHDMCLRWICYNCFIVSCQFSLRICFYSTQHNKIRASPFACTHSNRIIKNQISE